MLGPDGTGYTTATSSCAIGDERVFLFQNRKVASRPTQPYFESPKSTLRWAIPDRKGWSMSWILLLVPCVVTTLWILAYRLKDAGPEAISPGRPVRHKLSLD